MCYIFLFGKFRCDLLNLRFMINSIIFGIGMVRHENGVRHPFNAILVMQLNVPIIT